MEKRPPYKVLDLLHGVKAYPISFCITEVGKVTVLPNISFGDQNFTTIFFYALQCFANVLTTKIHHIILVI